MQVEASAVPEAAAAVAKAASAVKKTAPAVAHAAAKAGAAAVAQVATPQASSAVARAAAGGAEAVAAGQVALAPGEVLIGNEGALVDTIWVAGRVELGNSLAKNAKVPPKTILSTFTGGKVGAPNSEGDFKWSFGSVKSRVAWQPQGAAALAVVTLDDVLRASPKVDSLYQHNPFTPGVLPSVIVPRKSVAVSGGSDAYQKAMAAVSADDPHLEFIWQVKVAGNQIAPHAVCLAVKKQLVVPAQGRWCAKQHPSASKV